MKKLASLFILFCLNNAIAQEEIIIIDKSNYKESKQKEIRLNDNIRVVKFSPLAMLAGEINFAYERQVSQKGSIEIGFGPTISKIGLGVNSHLINNGGNFRVNSGMGFFSSFGYRFYPLDETEALNRLYVSPVIRYKLFNYSYTDQDGLLPDQNASDTRVDFLFNCGYQMWASKKFSVDFFGGIGIGHRNEVEYYIDSQYTPEGTWEYTWVKNSYTGARYVVTCGILLGIGSE